MTKKINLTRDKNQLTPKEVVEAIIKCFYQAHCKSEEFQQIDKKISQNYCHSVVKKAFSETNGDIENPSKQSIIKAMNYLKTFSSNFREQKIVEKHYQEIMTLVEKIK